MLGDMRFLPFRLQGLGLEQGGLRLEAYHPRWKRLFSEEAHLIYDTLRLEPLRLHHIGSTAIQGLSAKPILDIIGEVPNLELIDQLQIQVESIGYRYLGESGIPQRRFCILQDSMFKSYVHLHLFPSGHPEVYRHILFRDFLRSSEEARQSYELSKISLIKDEKVGREK
ncbi:MAG: GrpB family protein, partial [Pseudobdellovibrionaceae bacterium]|nr:GrpB family protein [Pseudobdellovibrionaceae bacterium]